MKKVLIVDDSLEFHRLFKLIFEDYRYDFQYVFSGQEALEKINDQQFDLVISDWEMRHGNGEWLLSQILKMPAPPKVIIISGHMFLSEEKLLKMGANGFFHKPFSILKFLNHFESVLDYNSSLSN